MNEKMLHSAGQWLVHLFGCLGLLLLISTAQGELVHADFEEALPQNQIHEVQTGETLWSIAHTYDIQVTELIEANHLTSDLIRVGQKLKIPSYQSVQPEQDSALELPTGSSTYTVQSGDSLWKIANLFDTSIHALEQINDLHSDVLQIGQLLQLPKQGSQDTVDQIDANMHLEDKPTSVHKTKEPVRQQPIFPYPSSIYGHPNWWMTTNRDYLRMPAHLGSSLQNPISSAPFEDSLRFSASDTAAEKGDSLKIASFSSSFGNARLGFSSGFGTARFGNAGFGNTMDHILKNTYTAPIGEERLFHSSTENQNQLLADRKEQFGVRNHPAGHEKEGQEAAISVASLETSVENKSTAYENVTEEDIEWLAKIIEAEAEGEPYLGKVAVGSVVINRLEDDWFPDTIEEVIFQRVNKVYQFSPVGNGRINRITPSEDAYKAAEEALNGEDPTGGALYFYNASISNDKWIRTRTISTEIGQHKFAF